MPDLSIVVPLLDEAATLEELVARLRSTLDGLGRGYELLFVDDGSRDETPRLLRRLESEDPRIRVFEFTRNFGQAAALACGLFESRGAVVVTLDGDLQNPPEEIPKLLEALDKGADVATGRRIERHVGFARRVGARIVHFVARALTGADIQDFGGQFKAYRRSVIDAVRPAWSPGKPFFPLALWSGFPVAEIVVRHDPRRSGESRYTLRSLLRINIDLVTAFSTLPLAGLGVAGAGFLGAGLLGMLLYAALPEPGWFLGALALTLFALGGVLLAAGVLGQYLGRVYRQVAGETPAWVLRRGPRDSR